VGNCFGNEKEKSKVMAGMANDDDYHTATVQYCNAFLEKLFGGDGLPNLPRGQLLNALGQI